MFVRTKKAFYVLEIEKKLCDTVEAGPVGVGILLRGIEKNQLSEGNTIVLDIPI